MFNKKTNEMNERPQSSAATIVAPGTIVKGDFESNYDLRVDGKVLGNIRSKSKVVIGVEGSVEGTIEGVHADISGYVKGELYIAESLVLRNKSIIDGNIFTNNFSMENGSTFNGNCKMGSVVVNLMQNEKNELQPVSAVFH